MFAEELEQALKILATLPGAGTLHAQSPVPGVRRPLVKRELDPAEAHAILARHVASVLSRALNALPQEDQAAAQSELTNQIIGSLAANPAGAGAQDDLVEIPPEELRAIQPIGKTPNPNRDDRRRTGLQTSP